MYKWHSSRQSRLFSIVTDTKIQQCREFIDNVREVRFFKVRDMQVSKFNRLLHKK